MPAALVLLLVWNATESVLACPNQIAYFNTFLRNPETKYRYVADSNLDWGNELYALKDFMQAHQLTEISLQYFGNTDPANYGIRYKQANGNSTGWVAISATDLVGAMIDRHDDEYAAFRTMKPCRPPLRRRNAALLSLMRLPPDNLRGEKAPGPSPTVWEKGRVQDPRRRTWHFRTAFQRRCCNFCSLSLTGKVVLRWSGRRNAPYKRTRPVRRLRGAVADAGDGLLAAGLRRVDLAHWLWLAERPLVPAWR